ncbi:MAG TPA: beta-propeller fold lactonase family protein [Steroidobacteraceae bacterium]|nr:beta-propeller fold lactonase family protein [Steroidobacteraceae bacterium]
MIAYAAHAYVSNEDQRTVSVLDTTRGEVTATIQVGKRPRGLKLSADGARLYVAVSGLPKCPPSMREAECSKLEHDVAADGIAVVDTQKLKVLKVLRAGSDPEQFDVDKLGQRLYVANEDSAALSVVDIPQAKVLTRVPVGREPEGVRITPNGEFVLVTSETDNTVSVISTHTLQLVRTINVGHRPRDVAFSRDGRTAYVSGEFDATVSRFAVSANTPVEKLIQLRKEDRPMGVLLDATDSRLYVSTGRGGTIAVIAPAQKRLIAEVPVGSRPWGMAMTPDQRLLFTANGPSNDVSVIELATLKVLKTIPVGRSPWGVVIGR